MDSSSEHSIRLLNEDVLHHIFTYLDRKSLTNFAQTCKAMRDLIYSRPALWKQSVPVLRLSDVSEDTVRSIKERNITTISLNRYLYFCDEEHILKYCEALEPIKTLVFNDESLDQLSVFHPDYECKSIECILSVLRLGISEENNRAFERSLPVFPNLRELHLYNYTSFDVELSKLGCLPNLSHIEYYGMYQSDVMRLFMYDPYIVNFLPPGGLQKLARMAGVTVAIFNQLCIRAIVESFPMLKHFKAECSFFHCDKNDGQILSLESLELRGLLFYGWIDLAVFLGCVPNLRALAVASSCLSGLERRLLHSLATSCPKLTVIKLTNITDIHEKVLKQIVVVVKQLQVLEVRMVHDQLIHLSDSAVSELLESAKSLISLLGILADERFHVLPNLKFKSSAADSDVVLMRHSINSWQRLSKHSDKWNDAYGISYFYPKDSICNIELSQHVTSHLE